MGDFRIKYGSAIGPENNFFARSDNVFSSTDTTPDVTNGTLWFANNASATTITNFDLATRAHDTGTYEGKRITVVFLDGYTTLAAGTFLKMAGTASVTFPANSTLDLIYHNTAWYEIGRSLNAITDVSRQTASGSSVGITNVMGIKTVLYAATAKSVIWSISGGQIGQELNIVSMSTSGIVAEVSAGGNIYLMGTASFTMVASGVYKFVNVDGTKWYWMKGAVA